MRKASHFLLGSASYGSGYIQHVIWEAEATPGVSPILRNKEGDFPFVA
jgi:hypothetical protein